MNASANLLPYSVIVPAFNAARTLHAALSSVLNQTVPPEVIVVVDDGSMDETAAIARSFDVTLISRDNRGPAAATDCGIAAVATPVIAGLDADDVWFPDKARRQLALLSSKPHLDAAFCHSATFKHGDAPDATGPSRESWSRSAMMMRRLSAERIGPVFDAGNPRGLGEMIRWFDTGRRLGLEFDMMPDVLVGRRIIEGSLSFARDPAGFLPMIRGKLAGRRS